VGQEKVNTSGGRSFKQWEVARSTRGTLRKWLLAHMIVVSMLAVNIKVDFDLNLNVTSNITKENIMKHSIIEKNKSGSTSLPWSCDLPIIDI
jgi:hypothetical protein